MSKKFIEEKMVSITEDLDKIRTKPLVYISYVGEQGALHLGKELINNGIDECINPNSPGKNICIELDGRINKMTVTDDGRGFPFAGMVESCTVIHSSTKFIRATGGGSAGENGVGITATNALSDFFEIDVHKLGERSTITFKEGKLIKNTGVVKCDDKKKHGSKVSFIPSPKYLLGECEIKHEALITWLQDIKHLLDQNIVMDYIYTDKDGKKHKYKLKNINGLRDMCVELESSLLCDPVHVKDSVKFKEKVRDVETGNMTEKDRFLGLEVAFSYKKPTSGRTIDEPTIKSFCNFVHTIRNGTHADAVRNSIAQFLVRATREIMSKKDLEKYDITSQDALFGLVLTLSVTTDSNPGFTNQTKENITKPEMYKIYTELTKVMLMDYFKTRPKELKRLCDYIKTNAKARYEATKARTAVVRRETDKLSEYGIKGYKPANDKSKKGYREIFLCEGDSVGGNAEKARDKMVQALFLFRGVPYNTFNKKAYEVLGNEEFKNLNAVLRCGIGDRFDINKLYFDKIIIMTDADVDGHFITSLISAFFVYHLPDVVKAGKLYKSLPPLYKIDDKTKPFILNKMQYIEVFERRIGENLRIIKSNNEVLKGKEFKDFLYNNRNYLDELMRVASHFAIHPILMEFVLMYMHDKKFPKLLNKRFPEITVEKSENKTMVVSGILEGKYQLLFIDDILLKKSVDMLKYIDNLTIDKSVTVLEKHVKHYNDLGKLSIGEFFMRAQKYQPNIMTRFKGLGELSSEDLETTTFDPHQRILVQLTMDDLIDEIRKFEILHGRSKEERTEMMKAFKIDREFLDN